MESSSLLHSSDRIELRSEGNMKHENIVTFRECLRLSDGNRKYQNQIFILMAAFWIFSSFFISLQTYLFKRPRYCQFLPIRAEQCCLEEDSQCYERVCSIFANSITEHVLKDRSLTYQFGLFCGTGLQWMRVTLKILPEVLSLVGMLFYGKLADRKGRKTAIKISWRMYTVGIIVFATTQTMPLRIFGYIIACVHCYPSLISQFTLIFQLNIEKSKNKSSLLLLACLFVGPLILSVTSKFLLEQDTRVLLTALCAVPALILSFLVNYLVQSPIFTYPFNKVLAFNIVNQVARINKQPPILIDLSRSHWHLDTKASAGQHSFLSLLKRGKLTLKLAMGIFFMFTIYMTIKTSQIVLDPYTDVFRRNIITTIPSGVADLTLCFFLNRFMNKTCRYMIVGNCFLLIALIFLNNYNLKDSQGLEAVYTTIVIGIRYLSELCYGIILIWAIQNFPTANRSYCVGIILTGSSVAVLFIYAVRQYTTLVISIALACSIFALFFQQFLELNGREDKKMLDTFDGKYYDDHDIFYKF